MLAAAYHAWHSDAMPKARIGRAEIGIDRIERIGMNALLREKGEFLYNGLNPFKDFSKLTDD
jgi:hypothetical protein